MTVSHMLFSFQHMQSNLPPEWSSAGDVHLFLRNLLSGEKKINSFFSLTTNMCGFYFLRRMGKGDGISMRVYTGVGGMKV